MAKFRTEIQGHRIDFNEFNQITKTGILRLPELLLEENAVF